MSKQFWKDKRSTIKHPESVRNHVGIVRTNWYDIFIPLNIRKKEKKKGDKGSGTQQPRSLDQSTYTNTMPLI